MIRTKGLTKRFRRVTALDKLTLEVPEGAIFALLGPNGAGKSTLLKTLVNIIRADSGTATVFGIDSRRLSPEDLTRIGYVSESQKLPDWMRVGEFLRYCKPFYPAWDDALASRLLAALRLPEDRRLRDLSRGMRMKAALVSSLAYRPKLLLLDEPFGGLDVLVRDEICETLLAEADGPTILLASHDLADLESFASHVAYISDGRLLFAEEMSELTARFRQVEVTLDNAPEIADWPSHWMAPERTDHVIRFTDTHHDPAQVERYFPQASFIHAEGLSLRNIFVALARERRESHDLAHS